MGLGSKAHFGSAVLGGLVVAGGFLVFGVGRQERIETVVDQAPVAAAQTPLGARSGLTPHDIYQRNAPGVVFVRAKLVEQVANPFDLFHARESDMSTGLRVPGRPARRHPHQLPRHRRRRRARAG